MAAEHATPEAVAFMIRYTSGIICVPMEEERLARLDLPQMVRQQRRRVSHGVHRVGGLSARHHHRRLLERPCRDDPRAGRTPTPPRRTSRGPDTSFRCAPAKAACSCAPVTPKPRWICAASPACKPAGVLCELMNDDGTMARRAADRGVRAAAQSEDRHHRRSHSLIACATSARSSACPSRRCRRNSASSACMPTRTACNTACISRWCTVGSMGRSCRSCACTSPIRCAICSESQRPARVDAARRDGAHCRAGQWRGGHPARAGVARESSWCRGASTGVSGIHRRSARRRRRRGRVLRTYGVGAQILKDLGVRRMRVLSAPKQMHGISAFDLEIEGYVARIDERWRTSHANRRRRDRRTVGAPRSRSLPRASMNSS